MRFAFLLIVAFTLVTLPTAVRAQGKMKQDERFPTQKPAVGDPLPDLTIYTTDGKPVQTAELRGQYTVLVFGCLT